jgi:hypothetical protein
MNSRPGQHARLDQARSPDHACKPAVAEKRAPLFRIDPINEKYLPARVGRGTPAMRHDGRALFFVEQIAEVDLVVVGAPEA